MPAKGVRSTFTSPNSGILLAVLMHSQWHLHTVIDVSRPKLPTHTNMHIRI